MQSVTRIWILYGSCLALRIDKRTTLVAWSNTGPHAIHIILPARRYVSAGNSDRNVSVCPSVRLSVTRQYCVKTKKASGMISSPSGSPKTLVFWRQISSPNSKGFPRTGASNKGRSKKLSDFLALSVNISKTVADTAKVTINDEYEVTYGLSIDTQIDDLGWPWTAVRSNFVGISRDLSTLGGNHG